MDFKHYFTKKNVTVDVMVKVNKKIKKLNFLIILSCGIKLFYIQRILFSQKDETAVKGNENEHFLFCLLTIFFSCFLLSVVGVYALECTSQNT